MNNLEESSDPNPSGPDPKPSSHETVADHDAPPSSDFNHVSNELSDNLKNVGLNETVSVIEGNGETDQKEEEEEGRRNGIEKRMNVYPLRPNVEDCSFYMRTGSCKYGSSCKFNHPIQRKLQIGREKKVREEEENLENQRLMECKYFFRTGGCKYGESCKFSHTKEQQTSLASSSEFNFVGLPIRPGEKECPFFIRTGSCKFRSDCKFNHPNPTPIGNNNNGGYIGLGASLIKAPSQTSWSSSKHMNGTASPFIPFMYSQNRGASEWNGYRATGPLSTYPMNNSLAEYTSFSQYSQLELPEEEFPERPDQPECSYYVKTGDCKFKYKCKYHHPKNRLPKQPPSSFNDKGLPLRPEQNMCTHYSRYGICKFGPACRFDHSIPSSFSSRSFRIVEAP